MGLRTVVHNLYGDLFSGTVIFKLYDLIKSGSVDWTRVNSLFSTTPAKANFQHLGVSWTEASLYEYGSGVRANENLSGATLKVVYRAHYLGLSDQLSRRSVRTNENYDC
ncbi:hypothetical protein ACTXT7_012944 [Hymenolepis weldensis]